MNTYIVTLVLTMTILSCVEFLFAQNNLKKVSLTVIGLMVIGLIIIPIFSLANEAKLISYKGEEYSEFLKDLEGESYE